MDFEKGPTTVEGPQIVPVYFGAKQKPKNTVGVEIPIKNQGFLLGLRKIMDGSLKLNPFFFCQIPSYQGTRGTPPSP